MPQGPALGAFDVDAINEAFSRPAYRCLGIPIVSMDAAERGSDAFVFATVGFCLPTEAIEDKYLIQAVVDSDGNELGGAGRGVATRGANDR